MSNISTQLALQPGLLDQLAENIVNDSYNYICSHIPHYFNNVVINCNDTVANTNPKHAMEPNWLDSYCYKGYDTFCDIIGWKSVSASASASEGEVVVITHAKPSQTSNWFDDYCYRGYKTLCNFVAWNPLSVSEAVTKAGLWTSLYHMPHIVNSIYTIPAGEYSLGNSLAMVIAIVSQQEGGLFAYQLGLNVWGGNGVVLNQHVFSPFTKFGTIAAIQFFSNKVSANPALFDDYTVLFTFKPWVLISSYWLIKWVWLGLFA